MTSNHHAPYDLGYTRATMAVSYTHLTQTLDETLELIKKNSRNYAKRQYTWFNNQVPVIWFNVNLNNFNETINAVISELEG